MVKLNFNPKKDPNDNCVESKSTKKKVFNLNPFNEIKHLDFSNLKISESKSNELVPKSTRDLIGLENTCYILKEWYFNSLYDSLKQFLLIIGPTGCGKSTLINLFCKENNISLFTVKFSYNTKTKKDLLKEIILFCEYSSTSFFEKNTNSVNKLILIDEYQNGQNDLLSITDINNLMNLRNGSLTKKEIQTIFEINQINLPPVLIISSDSKGSKLSDLKKSCEVYYINEINIGCIKSWITKFYPNTHDHFLKKCGSDKRLLINTLLFSKGKFESYIKNFYKDSDTNIFDFTSNLFTEDCTLKEIFKIYEIDGFSIANLIQENYLDFNQDIHAVADAAEALSYGETVFSDTYGSNKSFLPDSHCVNSICLPIYYTRCLDKKKHQIRSSYINNRYNIYLNNKKIIEKIKLNTYFDQFDIHFIKKFLNQELVKTKCLSKIQEDYLKNILNSFNENKIEKIELVYKHFSEFKDLTGKEPKAKNFTLKFKEKLNKLLLK